VFVDIHNVSSNDIVGQDRRRCVDGVQLLQRNAYISHTCVTYSVPCKSYS